MLATKTPSDIQTLVCAAVQKHGATHEAVIPILSELNHELGYLSVEALTEVARQLHLPTSNLNAVATFYSMLSTQARGRHVIQFCENAPCHVVGGRAVWQAVQERLRLAEGETTPDGKWTLLTTSCLGICAVGPVLVIDEDVYGNVEPGQVGDILAKYE